MSGTATKTIAAAGQATDVAITLKRDVAKIAVQSSLSDDFASKYPGKIKVNSAKISRAASQTPYFGGTIASGAMTYTHTQTLQEDAGKYNSLFYLFENGTLAAGSRVLLTLEAIYDKDGNFSTTGDQTPVTYEVELKGTSDNGTIHRTGRKRHDHRGRLGNPGNSDDRSGAVIHGSAGDRCSPAGLSLSYLSIHPL